MLLYTSREYGYTQRGCDSTSAQFVERDCHIDWMGDGPPPRFGSVVNAVLFTPVAAGTATRRGAAPVVMSEGFDAHPYLEMLTHYRVTMAFGVPTQFAMMRETSGCGRPLPSLRTFLSGGAPCRSERRRTCGRISVSREGYGLTRCNELFRHQQLHVPCSGVAHAVFSICVCAMRTMPRWPSVTRFPTARTTAVWRVFQRTGTYRGDDGQWSRTGDLASRDSDSMYTIGAAAKTCLSLAGKCFSRRSRDVLVGLSHIVSVIIRLCPMTSGGGGAAP